MSTAARVDAWLASLPPARFRATQATQQLFAVSFTRPDGSGAAYHRHGGTSTQHADEAMELAGLGGVVKVAPIEVPA